MRRRNLAWLIAFALTGCGREGQALPSQPSMEDASVIPTVRTPDASVTDASGPKAIDPPSFSCGDKPPRALSALCMGCHKLGSDGAYPDLLAFAGSEADFIAQVRKGGGGMPAFSVGELDDATAKALYAYVTSAKAPAQIELGNIVPLFQAKALTPISFTRSDGVLVTRGAGRVRQRHELEGTFGPFGPLYFEDRTYGFVIEDFTVRGDNRIVVTYLPVAMPTEMTNFRAFKIYGNGNVFHANTGMDSDTKLPAIDGVTDYAKSIAPYARVQSHEVKGNARTGKPLQKGELFEFEFGVFIDKAAVRENSRTAYYTDTFRYRVGEGTLTPESADTSGKLGPNANAQLGGGTSTAWEYEEPETYMSQLALNVQHEHVQTFVEGRRLFHTNFDSGEHSEPGNPVFAEQAHKRGPDFVASACVDCHPHNGGGRTLTGTLDEKSSMTFKLYGGRLGNQLQLNEGTARASTETRSVKLGDGTTVTLTKPKFDVRDKANQALASSARIARRLVGMGLLEAIDESTLLAQADPDDCDGDGISGRPQLIEQNGELRVGRFGWRAEKLSVSHQVTDALDADLDTTLNEDDLARLATYMRLLGVPPQRDADDVQQGEQLFHEVGCANCHVPAVTTGNTHPFVELRAQAIRPYSDLLLHDLGDDLADDTGASEWRTPPLWGVGLAQTVQGYVSLLHDGRAASVLEAVLWHGGEAQAVRDRVIALPSDQREALLRFVGSL